MYTQIHIYIYIYIYIFLAGGSLTLDMAEALDVLTSLSDIEAFKAAHEYVYLSLSIYIYIYIQVDIRNGTRWVSPSKTPSHDHFKI